jgi:hypothetical protein
MSGTHFDLIGLARAFVVSLGAGLIARAIASFIVEHGPRKRVVTLAIAGGVLVLTVTLSALWPSLVTVPRLDGLSRAEAENLLANDSLTPDPKPQHASGVQAGRVVPNSQNPKPGLRVRRGEVVSFGVAEPPAELSPSQLGSTVPSQAATVSLFEPRGRGSVRCIRAADGIYRFSVRGTSTGLGTGAFSLLLWVRPVNPPAEDPRWYLQRPPVNGIRTIEADGSWEGLAQIGNAQWPPHEGDVLDVAVSVAGRDVAEQLMAETGVVLRDQPVGVHSVRASSVVVTMR